MDAGEFNVLVGHVASLKVSGSLPYVGGMRSLVVLLCLVASPALADECRYVSDGQESVVINDETKTLEVIPLDGDGSLCEITSRTSVDCDGDPFDFARSADGDLTFMDIVWHRKSCRTPV